MESSEGSSESGSRYQRLNAKIRKAIDEKPKRDALYTAMKRGRDSRARAILNRADGGAFRKEVRAAKVAAIENLEALVEQFAENSRKRGANVFMAKDGPAAIEYILEVCRRKNARSIAKSKSLTTEEIHVNEPIEEAGMEIIETDLGELILQMVKEKPFHLVFPAVHKTAEEVAEIFTKALGIEIPPDVKIIMKAVRKYLRPIFLNADIGMTGANVGIAENGAIVIETNEGNARMVSSIPDVHICVMGMEKIVPSVEDGLRMMMAHPVSATGQPLTTYVTMMAGRSPLGEGEGRTPRETHIIILDNGRMEMRKDPILNDALNCIRCGACMNICPTYGVVGGHAFGYIYPGPIGIPWTAAVHGQDNAADFSSLCVSCGLCKEICPAEIDIPMMIAEVKNRDLKKNPPPFVNRVMMVADQFAQFGSMTAPFSNWSLRNPLFRWVLEKTAGIDRRRNLPAFARTTLKRRFKKLAPIDKPARNVALFADTYANYNRPDLGLAAVERMRSNGCQVHLPPQKSSGYPFIGYGDLTRARAVAEYNVAQLAPLARAGYDIVTIEPTAAYCLKVSYPKLLHTEDAQLVADRSYEIFEYLLKIGDKPTGKIGNGKKLGFHVSCHQRPISSGKAAIDWVRQGGADVEVVETGTCCGMAGTFGLKTGLLGYELSQAVGEPLFEAFAAAKVDAIITESSVCKIQLSEGTPLKVYHPLDLLKEN